MKRHSRGLLGNFSEGVKEGSFDDDWIVVKKKKKTKKPICPQSTVSEVFDGSFRAPICKSGTKSSPGLKFSGPRCSQIQKGFNASPFSGPNIAGSASAGKNSVSASANKNVHSILNDPEVRSLERLLRVKSKVEICLPGRLLDPPPVSVPVNQVSTVSAGLVTAGTNSRIADLLDFDTGVATVMTAGDSERVTELLEVSTGLATDSLAGYEVSRHVGCDAESHATAGGSERVIELLEVDTCSATDSIPGYVASRHAGGDAESHATAGESEEIIGLHVSHSRRTVTSMHALTAHNSWSDTVRNSRCTGGLLPMCKSTSYNLEVASQGPTGRRCTKGGVSGPAEDLRHVSEVEAGVNFRPAGGVRGQVAGSLPRRQPGTGTRRVREGVVTPSLHPEVPGIQFVSPGRGLDIRQSMGWTKVCSTARSGIWVLKGNARARMLPENLDHLRVRWISRGTYETAWVTPGHDCLCSYKYGHGAAVRPQTNDAIWRGVIGLWGRVAPLLSPWCGRRELPTGVNLNRYSVPSSCIRWHSDNEPWFGPQNSPKLIVSMSLGNSVEFKVRRVRCSVPSLITLDHGDLLVMDGSTQSEYVHCTASGLQGPRVNLTFRWVAQHIASCPLAGVVGCVLPSCVQGLAEPGPRGDGGWGNKWSFFWGLVLLLLILVSFLLVGSLISIRRGHRYSDQRPSCSVVHFPSRGRPLGWGTALVIVSTSPNSQGFVFLFPFYFIFGGEVLLFF